jgi:hypothetical protein
MAHSNNKNTGTTSLLMEILASFTACTPARGRHQLHFLPNEQETPSQKLWTAVIAVEIIVG